MKALEDAKLIRRVQNKTPAGDWGANTYYLDGLIARIKEIEPDFDEERQQRDANRKKAHTPKGLRKSPSMGKQASK